MKVVILTVCVLVLVAESFALRCTTCKGEACISNSLSLECNRAIPTLPFSVSYAVDQNSIDVEYRCLSVEYSAEDGNLEQLKQCVLLTENVDICEDIANEVAVKQCQVTATDSVTVSRMAADDGDLVEPIVDDARARTDSTTIDDGTSSTDSSSTDSSSTDSSSTDSSSTTSSPTDSTPSITDSSTDTDVSATETTNDETTTDSSGSDGTTNTDVTDTSNSAPTDSEPTDDNSTPTTTLPPTTPDAAAIHSISLLALIAVLLHPIFLN